MVGFVFFAKSPRHLGFEAARALGAQARGRAQIVALSVDADDDALDAHRRGARPRHPAVARPRNSGAGAGDRRRFAPLDDEGDRRRGAATISPPPSAYDGAADFLLIDAKPPTGAVLPGGNGRAVRLAPRAAASRRARRGFCPGGLDPDNVARGDRADRRARRRRLLGRRERAGRQGCGQDRGLRRRGARAPSRARPKESSE